MAALEELPDYSSIDSTVPDIMHDILEGIGKKELKRVLDMLVKEKCITVDELNNNINSLKYGWVAGCDVTPCAVSASCPQL